MKNCTNCGTSNDDNAKFCEKCGSALPVAIYQSQQQSQDAPVSDGLKIGIIIASVLIPLIGLIMGFMYLNDANPNKKKVGKTWLWAAAGGIVLYFLIYGG